ncbi:reverse transcriptase domain-containing protein [Tanacetum coccineum]
MADNRTMEELLQAPTEGANTNFRESSNKTDERIDKLTNQISTLVEIVSKKVVAPTTVKAVEESYVYCGGAHTNYNCPDTDSNQSNVCATMGAYNHVAPPNRVSNHMAPPGFAQVQINGQNSKTIPNPKGDMKAITTRSGVAYEGPSIPTNPSPLKAVERETEETMDKEQTNFQGSTTHIQPPVNPISIPFSPTIKSLLMNKDKLFELAKIPLNEKCSAMLLKKLPEKLGDPGKFLIPCDFPGMDVCHALADLGASINLMPFSIWKKLSLPDLSPTRMILELADRSITCPKGVAEDIFVKVGKFHFPIDFVVVDFEADPRVSLILGRSFLRTGYVLIDHANESINMINFIDVICEDSFEEVLRLKKSNHPSSGSTTPLSDSRLSLTSFEASDSLLEEFADELALLDPFPPGNGDVNFKADLREIKLFLNRDLSTKFSPKITIDPNPERFINEPALVCLPLPGDDDNDKGYDFHFCANKMIFSNPLFGFNDDFTSSHDESLPDEDVPKDNSNPLFEFGDENISSEVNLLFNEMLEDVESKDSNVSNLDEPALLVTPLFNEDECVDPGGDIVEIDAFLDDYKDSRENVIKACHWPVLTTRRTRVSKETHQQREFYTKTNRKEAHFVPNDWIATLAIRVLSSHLTATIHDPMIRKDQGLRSKGTSQV